MKGLKKSLCLFLCLAILLSMSTPVPVFAATNKQLTFSTSLTKSTEETMWDVPNYFRISKHLGKFSAKGVLLSSELYVPKKLLDQKGACMYFYYSIDQWNNSKHVASGYGTKSFEIKNVTGKKLVITGRDEKNGGKSDKLSAKNVTKYISYKKSGKYYVFTIKNVTLQSQVYKNEKASNITNKKYDFDLMTNITFASPKAGKFVIGVDNYKITNSKRKTLGSENFNKLPSKGSYRVSQGYDVDLKASAKVLK